MAGRKHLKTSDVHKVCNEFRELRARQGKGIDDTFLDLNELAEILGFKTNPEVVAPLFRILADSDDSPQCDFRSLLVAMAGLTRAKAADRMKFAALLLDEDATGSMSVDQLALILHANALLCADEPLSRDEFERRAQELVGSGDAISHQQFLEIVNSTPEKILPLPDLPTASPSPATTTPSTPAASRPGTGTAAASALRQLDVRFFATKVLGSVVTLRRSMTT